MKTLKNSTKNDTKVSTTESSKFNPESRASYGQVQKISMHFSKSDKCPKDIKFGTLRGHFLSRLNDLKKPLTQGQVTKLLTLKSVPSGDLKAMRSFRDIKNNL